MDITDDGRLGVSENGLYSKLYIYIYNIHNLVLFIGNMFVNQWMEWNFSLNFCLYAVGQNLMGPQMLSIFRRKHSAWERLL